MTIDEVITYFGSAWKMNQKIGMAHQNINNWKRYGFIPIMTQMKIEKLTDGELKASLDDCKAEKAID